MKGESFMTFQGSSLAETPQRNRCEKRRPYTMQRQRGRERVEVCFIYIYMRYMLISVKE